MSRVAGIQDAATGVSKARPGQRQLGAEPFPGADRASGQQLLQLLDHQLLAQRLPHRGGPQHLAVADIAPPITPVEGPCVGRLAKRAEHDGLLAVSADQGGGVPPQRQGSRTTAALSRADRPADPAMHAVRRDHDLGLDLLVQDNAGPPVTHLAHPVLGDVDPSGLGALHKIVIEVVARDDPGITAHLPLHPVPGAGQLQGAHRPVLRERPLNPQTPQEVDRVRGNPVSTRFVPWKGGPVNQEHRCLRAGTTGGQSCTTPGRSATHDHHVPHLSPSIHRSSQPIDRAWSAGPKVWGVSAPHTPVHLWIRSESRATERRAPIVPVDAGQLIGQGVRITVEESAQRVFSTSEYAEAGCTIATAGEWVDAPADAYIVGIKELPDEPAALRHTHIYFAHAYKGQAGAAQVLRRFAHGGGELLDVEYLTVDGRRVVAFGYWAGYVGASLSLLQHAGRLIPPLQPTSREQLDAAVKRAATTGGRALVMGARGRSGVGACDALRLAGWDVTPWGLADTRILDHEAIRRHDILMNCVVTHRPQEPFVTCADIDVADRRLRVVGDVTCDVTSEHNVIAINTSTTTWDDPVRRYDDAGNAGGTGSARPGIDVIAIDNLPSLLPLEASLSFSADFVPWISDLDKRYGPFAAARGAFERAAY